MDFVKKKQKLLGCTSVEWEERKDPGQRDLQILKRKRNTGRTFGGMKPGNISILFCYLMKNHRAYFPIHEFQEFYAE